MKKFCFFICFILALNLLIPPKAALAAEPSPPQEVPELSAHSAILINAGTGSVIYGKNSLERRAMASTTKIMSALLTLEAGDLDKQFRVDDYAIRTEGSTMGLQQGDIVTRRILTYGMLLPSGNDAANAAAVSVSGSTLEFVKLMNARAEQLGMKNTNFKNPSGLDADGHFSTAYDLALLTMEALRNPDFAEICKKPAIRTEFGNPPYKRWLYNNNKLLKLYDGAIGVKTGFTDNARRCLVSAAERNGITLIAVTLNAHDDWNDHIKLFDYGFSVVKNRPVDFDASELYVNVAGGNINRASVRLAEPPLLPLSEEEIRRVEIKTTLVPFVYAGFEAGEQVGLAEFFYNGRLLKAIPIITAEGCEAPEEKLSFARAAVQFWRRALF